MSYRKETYSLLKRLEKAGFKLIAANDGMDTYDLKQYFSENTAAHATDIACSVDEAWVTVARDGYTFTLYLVYGNSPGELVCDYGWNRAADETPTLADLDQLTEDHYDEWSQHG